jgi:hypothetical protein
LNTKKIFAFQSVGLSIASTNRPISHMNTQTMNGFDLFGRRLARWMARVILAQIVLLHFSLAASAADAPKPPATAPVAPIAPPPSPKAIAQAFAAALDKGDAAAAKALLPADEIHGKWVDASIALSAALKKLDAAATARFNEAGKSVSQNQLHLLDSFKSLENAQEKIEGDSATLMPADQTQPLRLQRVDGKWQLQIGPGKADAPKQLALYARLTKAANTTAEEVAAGAYPSAEAAAKVFAARVLEARLAGK